MLKNDIRNYVVSSRIRLARNIAGMPFPNKLTAAGGQKVLDMVAEPLITMARGKLSLLRELSPIQIQAYKEQHLISNALAENAAISGVVLNNDNTMSVMINEEDHIRIQVIYRGMELDKAFAFADKIDDLIGEKNDISYDTRLGYITACPTNLGTGMRASVMMFLPALTINRTIKNVIFSGTKDSIAIRGVYGEGTEFEGNMYQLSNQYSLGMTERDIIDTVKNHIYKIAEAEEIARETLLQNHKVELWDTVMRSWGILTNAIKIDSQECLSNLSTLKLGAALGLIDIDGDMLDVILTQCQPANLSLAQGKELTPQERDMARATFLREALPKLKK